MVVGGFVGLGKEFIDYLFDFLVETPDRLEVACEILLKRSQLCSTPGSGGAS